MLNGARYNYHLQNALYLYTVDQIQRPRLNLIKLDDYD